MRDNYRPNDRYLKQLLQESYQESGKHQICQLPCGHGSFELEKPQDVYVMCNTCKKKFQLVWSKVNKQIKEIV